jgi:ubiquinone/menaquinone biosynthesis C-methylase UbiE
VTQDEYRRISKVYDTVIEPANAPLRRIGLAMHPPRRGMSVLDVGCGTGTHLALYAAAGCRVHGVDLSPAMLERARRRLGDDADLRLSDAANLPYPDDTFDVVVASMFLHELDETIRPAVLDEMKRTVKPDGRVLLIDFHPDGLSTKGRLARAVSTLVERLAGRAHFGNFRRFNETGGVPGLIPEGGFEMDRETIVSGGNIGIYLLQTELSS